MVPPKISTLTLISGCMKAGKTAMVIDLYNEYCGNVVLLKPSIDTRDPGMIRSRNGNHLPVDYLIPYLAAPSWVTLVTSKIKNLQLRPKAIIVDEAHFLHRDFINEFVKALLREATHIYVVCLTRRINGEPMPAYKLLKEMCDKEIHLYAPCDRCGGSAEQSYCPLVSPNSAPADCVENDERQYGAYCMPCFNEIKHF